MGRSIGFLALALVVAIGGYLFTRQAQSVISTGSNPETTVDVTAVRNDLIAIAKAERNYWASNAKYVSLDELRFTGHIQIPTRAHYSYSAETAETAFKIIATYSGTDPKAPKRITIDETMAITVE